MALVVKNLPASAGDVRDEVLIPASGRSPEDGNGNPLQYSCLENPMDRGAGRATVRNVAQSQTGLKRLSTDAHKLDRMGNTSPGHLLLAGLLISLCWWWHRVYLTLSEGLAFYLEEKWKGKWHIRVPFLCWVGGQKCLSAGLFLQLWSSKLACLPEFFFE